MEAEQIIESLANYISFLRVPNAVCISQLLLIDRRTPVDLWRHKCAFLATFNLGKLFIFVNSIKGIRARTFLGLTSICNNLTAKVSVKCIKRCGICASLKLTDLISLISICRNVQDHKLVWDTVDTFFYSVFLNYALLKKQGLAIVEIVWSTWKRVNPLVPFYIEVCVLVFFQFVVFNSIFHANFAVVWDNGPKKEYLVILLLYVSGAFTKLI